MKLKNLAMALFLGGALLYAPSKKETSATFNPLMEFVVEPVYYASEENSTISLEKIKSNSGKNSYLAKTETNFSFISGFDFKFNSEYFDNLRESETTRFRTKLSQSLVAKDRFNKFWYAVNNSENEKYRAYLIKNKPSFNLEELESTLDTLTEIFLNQDLDPRTIIPQSIGESIANQLKYGLLDEKGPFHIRESNAKRYFFAFKKRVTLEEKQILGDDYDSTKLIDPKYNSIFYVSLMSDILGSPNDVENSLRRYNGGSNWKKNNYDQFIKKMIKQTHFYEAYSMVYPKQWGMIYLSTMLPEFKFDRKIKIKNSFWSNLEPLKNPEVLHTLGQINFLAANDLLIDDKKATEFNKIYSRAKKLIQESN
ncbi:hypothetical protein J4465_02015 [Candidatus Pacearchaeota archaeon]|nr:hypothetical protein [Candidatus Pacearchaeota archaeon]